MYLAVAQYLKHKATAEQALGLRGLRLWEVVMFWEVLILSKLDTHSSFRVNEAQRGQPYYQWVSNVAINSVCAKQIGIKHVSYDDA